MSQDTNELSVEELKTSANQFFQGWCCFTLSVSIVSFDAQILLLTLSHPLSQIASKLKLSFFTVKR